VFRPRVIPTLLLSQRGLVKTIGFESPSYVGDPINAVKIFNDSEADELIFLDIDATAEGRRRPAELVRQISDEAFMPFTIGGGIRSVDDVRAMFDLGAEKVAINSAALDDPGVLEAAAEIYGTQAVIASLDARREPGGYQIYGRSGTGPSGLSPAEAARRAERSGAGEIMITSIDRDGTMSGFDLELTREVTEAVSIPVIACGGAGSYEELPRPILEAGASAVAAGSLFVYIGRKRAVLINYPDADELAELFAELTTH
jgi:cyclase